MRHPQFAFAFRISSVDTGQCFQSKLFFFFLTRLGVALSFKIQAEYSVISSQVLLCMQQNRISSNCAVVPAFLRWTEQQVHSFLLVSPQRQLSSNGNQYYFFNVSKHCKWAFHKEINPVH